MVYTRIPCDARDITPYVSGENISSDASSIEQTVNTFHALLSSEGTVQVNISTAKIDKSKWKSN